MKLGTAMRATLRSPIRMRKKAFILMPIRRFNHYLYFELNLNGSLERIIITLAVVSFAFTSVSLLSIQEVSLTREEAIEISEGSSLVKEGLAIAQSTSVEAHYYNSQRIEQLREWHQEEIFDACMHWQYAKIISESAGYGKKQFGFVMNRFKKLASGEINWSTSIREYVKEREKKDVCIYCGKKKDLTLDIFYLVQEVALTLRITLFCLQDM